MNSKINRFIKAGGLLLLFAVLSIGQIFAQGTITVKGVVLDENKDAVIGVAIFNDTKSVGIVTDIDGNFTLSCAAGEKLNFQAVGFLSQALEAQPQMNIVLKTDVVQLNDVVVVGIGYGTSRKKDITGAISSVSAKDLKKGVVTSSEQLLQGKVAGLTVIQGGGDPAKGSSMRLRGGTSLTASSSPLVVVDGVPGADFNSVQPTEIISIDVLKDASACAIYGSRGANGVIIVTTNREQAQSSVSYNGYVAIGQVAKNLDLLSADQWRGYVRDNNVTGAVDYGADTDWQKEIEQTAITHSHNVSMTSGNKDYGLRTSITYLNNEGVIKNSYLNRLSGSVSGYQYALNHKLKLEATINANTDKWSDIDADIFQRTYNLNPTIPVKQNGKYTQVGGTNNNNPVELLDNRNDDKTRNRLLAYTQAELTIIEGLKGVVNLSYESNVYQGRFYIPTYAFKGITDKGFGQRTLNESKNYQLETYFNYDVTFAEGQKINAMAGYSYLDSYNEGFGALSRGFDTDLLTYNKLEAGIDKRMDDVYSTKELSTLISFFGRINYNYSEKYSFTGTLRRDGSSKFGTNNKWGLFPSASIGWRFSQEAFMEGTQEWLNNAKLRVGYGVTGNQTSIPSYTSLSLFGVLTDANGNTGSSAYYDNGVWKNAYGATQNRNADLKWEETAQYNFGLDISLFNRFNATVEYYDKYTKDLLYKIPVSLSSGNVVGSTLKNVGELSNKGFEITLNGQVIRSKDFNFDATLTLAHNKQVVEKLSDDIANGNSTPMGSLHSLSGMSTVYSQVLEVGHAVGTFYGPKCSGIDANGNYIFTNVGADGKPVNEYLGDVQPKLTTGLTLNFSYKNLDLSVAAVGMFGQKVLNATAMELGNMGRLPGYNVKDSFVGSGVKQSPVYSDYWIEDGSFVRLQSLTLGYNVPMKNKFGIQKVRCYLTGENLFVISGYDGLDPEVSIDGLDRPGIDFINYYPRPRTFSLGVNVTF